ncbi:MAG: tRNA pseudouridine(55) synthase TruB [Candidatus Amulumruptor caecigallinarius]|uniref:tRNA pseudouridine synthase B n=1 Tax=Candidatus Amulumruptor caecigallinarius TaxID=2109911 RepID=A0A4Q0U7X4_9BACT|nr:MAG: tRNA pseudouridine(55) synthase TruB [Candidatus Amulumruptor caecigallinarius]HJE39652.1 tRNA pseudouridine(55) synthase TruB [Candidatus Amulumruptor caecigallinarius]
MDFISGEILLIDKPLGWTSFDAVKRVRGALTRRMKVKRLKVGHAGTLDPLATGVMVICTGRATKRIDQLQAGVKEYIATLSLGATTPSFDLETEVDATYPIDHITRQLAEETLQKFVGSIEQIPPAFSAVKIDGQRAYKMARKGQTPELKAKTLVIDEIELLDFAPDRLTLRIVCSKGTYIRALARDIGEALGSGAHLTALRRTRVGEFTIDRCMSVDEATAFIRDVDITMPEEASDKPQPQ